MRPLPGRPWRSPGLVDDTALRLLALLKALPGVLPLLARRPMPDDPDVALLHPKREEINRLVTNEPGLSITEISDAVNISYSETHRHVEKLVACGLLEKRLGSPARVYPVGKAPSSAPALSTDSAQAIARLLVEKSGLSSEEIAEATGSARTTVVLRLRELQDAKLVKMEKTGSAPLYHATAKLRKELSRN